MFPLFYNLTCLIRLSCTKKPATDLTLVTKVTISLRAADTSPMTGMKMVVDLAAATKHFVEGGGLKGGRKLKFLFFSKLAHIAYNGIECPGLRKQVKVSHSCGQLTLDAGL